ncbi:MAG: rane protein, partial [Paenibacillus sp.]|nr:rane protein [Paenibacillus sp.]
MFKGWNHFMRELASIGRNRRVLIPVIAVLLIPVLYAGMFLGAFWDPYGKLDKLPVAVVNEDQGAPYNGKTLRIGDELVDQLKQNRKFDWRFVSAEEAAEGIVHNDYYMVVTIPQPFSEQTTTLLTDHPTKAQLHYEPNPSYNFIASQIGASAMENVKGLLSEAITASYTKTLVEQMGQLAEGLGAASGGAGELADGTSKAAEGAKQLELRMGELAGGTLELQEGVAHLEAG